MKYLVFVLFIICFCSIISFSQGYYCYPVTHHIVTLDDRNGGLDTSEIPLIMSELNRAFASANIQFYMACEGIKIIQNDSFYNVYILQVYGGRNPFPYLNAFNLRKVDSTINIFYLQMQSHNS
jgi:hypothetical protein